MVMHYTSSNITYPAELKCLAVEDAYRTAMYTYLMEDVRFRIDTVANSGMGDTDDYMLKGVSEQTGQPSLTAFQWRLRFELNLFFRIFFL